ncbi:MAG: thiamine pyrophosphate-dependent dehydrogenase E1 component subunit alpha [Desulfovibrionales bacterium]|nr:MAG: thiamine pyrophosphate-dependent dehydrogenase E1 component subunit alpha [Desulfovibrionales bacterium]
MKISAEKQKEMLWTMLLSRRFEDELVELCKVEGKIPGMTILSTGQEAVGSGACAALEPEDVIITNHRSHNHLLAKGAEPNALMAEIYCKRTGCNKGKSGTLHLAVPEVNAPCTSTVVGAGPPIAVGQAFAQQYKGEQRVTACFFGDGAAAEGSVHEAMNLAALWRLPLIFICENNVYAGAQRHEEHTPVPNLAVRAAAYAMPGETVDGNDVLAVYLAVQEARERALAGEGPSLVECKTYRCRGHGETDPQHYQPREEICSWLEKCPIPRLRDDLIARGVLTAADYQEMEGRAESIVMEAVRFAEESPYPDPEEALEDVLA